MAVLIFPRKSVYSQTEEQKTFYPVLSCIKETIAINKLLKIKSSIFYDKKISSGECRLSNEKIIKHLKSFGWFCEKALCSRTRPSLSEKYIKYSYEASNIIIMFNNLKVLPLCESYSRMLGNRNLDAVCVGGKSIGFDSKKLKKQLQKLKSER